MTVKKKNKKTAHRNRYTDSDKDNARRYYLMGLNFNEIGKLINGCPPRTLEKWQAAGKWTELKNTTNIKIRASELHQSGKSYAEIAEILKISRVTVWRYIKANKRQ